MNFMEQYLLNRANQVAGSLSSGSSVSGGFPEFVSDTSAGAIPNSIHSIPFITTGWARQNSTDLNWDSSYSGQLTTPDFEMPNHQGAKMVFWNALGDKTSIGCSSFISEPALGLKLIQSCPDDLAPTVCLGSPSEHFCTDAASRHSFPAV